MSRKAVSMSPALSWFPLIPEASLVRPRPKTNRDGLLQAHLFKDEAYYVYVQIAS